MLTDEKSGIMYRCWRGAAPRAIVLLVHGLGGHCSRWEFLARYLQQNGIAGYALELRGFGQTPGLPGDVDSFETYFADIRSLHGLITRDFPGKKVFLLGESLGGLLAFTMAIKHPGFFNGLICIAPAFLSRLKFSPAQYVQVFSALCYAPRKQFIVPFNSQMCTRDVAYQRIMDQDNREHRLASARFLVNILTAQFYANRVKTKLAVPALFLFGGNDVLVKTGAIRAVFDGLKVVDKKIIEYPQMYHALSIDLEREKVFADIAGWTEKHCAKSE